MLAHDTQVGPRADGTYRLYDRYDAYGRSTETVVEALEKREPEEDTVGQSLML